MNRPYRDVEQAQARQVYRHAKNLVAGVQTGDLDFAWAALWQTEEWLQKLTGEVSKFDSTEDSNE